jgi:hypothetical protein
MGAPYVKRFGGGGFVDLPTQTTPIDSQFLNAVEDALVRLLGVTPSNNTVGVWTPGGANGALVYQQITNAQVDPAAAIARSKLDFGGGLTNSDIAVGAAIAYSKLQLANSIVNGDISPSAAIAIAKLAGYPTDATKFLRGDGSWVAPFGRLLGVVVISASGTYNTNPLATGLLVEAWGGGGAGGGAPTTAAGQLAAGGGGGGGAYSARLFGINYGTAALLASYSVTIGAGGTGVAGGAGNAGADTVFGSSIVVAKGGSGGPAGTAGSSVAVNAGGGAGGPASSGIGDEKIAGQTGGLSAILNTGGSVYGGDGGAAPKGYAGARGGFTNASFALGAAAVIGGGGGGSANSVSQGTTRAGGNGGDGLIVVWEYA